MDDGSPKMNSEGRAEMQVTLVDAPADYEAVLIEVIGFEYQLDTTAQADSTEDDDESDTEWQSADIDATIYNLLELNNGTEAPLADLGLDAGVIRNVRLILGENNSVVINGDTLALTTPSGQTSGLKLKIDGEVESDKNYKLVLDFDAALSVVSAGKSGQFILKPVIRAHFYEIEEEQAFGSISGIVFPGPDSIPSVAYLIREVDTLSTFPEETGYFMFANLAADTYNLMVMPTDSSELAPILVNDLTVSAGETIELDTLRF